MKKTFQLPKEFAEEWYAALESGKYEQGTDSLVSVNESTGNEQYCCLGVAGCIRGLKIENLEEQPMLDSYLNELIENSIPESLLSMEDHAKLNETNLGGICANLNDGCHNTTYNNIIKQYPNIIFKKEIKFNNNYTMDPFTFKEIVEFLKDNVELV